MQTPQTAKHQCLETFHMQVLGSAGDGWHLWIWLVLLVEPVILGKAKENWKRTMQSKAIRQVLAAEFSCPQGVCIL